MADVDVQHKYPLLTPQVPKRKFSISRYRPPRPKSGNTERARFLGCDPGKSESKKEPSIENKGIIAQPSPSEESVTSAFMALSSEVWELLRGLRSGGLEQGKFPKRLPVGPFEGRTSRYLWSVNSSVRSNLRDVVAAAADSAARPGPLDSLLYLSVESSQQPIYRARVCDARSNANSIEDDAVSRHLAAAVVAVFTFCCSEYPFFGSKSSGRQDVCTWLKLSCSCARCTSRACATVVLCNSDGSEQNVVFVAWDILSTAWIQARRQSHGMKLPRS